MSVIGPAAPNLPHKFLPGVGRGVGREVGGGGRGGGRGVRGRGTGLGAARYARRWGQISNRHISETAKDNPTNMVLKSVLLRLEESDKIGLETLRGRITEITFYGKDLD